MMERERRAEAWERKGREAPGECTCGAVEGDGEADRRRRRRAVGRGCRSGKAGWPGLVVC